MGEVKEFVLTLGPNVVYVALIVGIWLAIAAIYVPGTGALEAAALVSLTIAGVGLAMLPTSFIGVVLLALALGCFLALIYFRHSWALIVAGAVLQVLGSIFLFRAGAHLSPLTIVVTNAAALAFHQIVLLPGLRIQDQARRVDVATLIGMDGQVIARLDPVGTVRVHGEVWTALAEQVIESGQWVRVVGREGLQLRVVPSEGPALWTGDSSGESPHSAHTNGNGAQAEVRLVNLLLVAVLIVGAVVAILIDGFRYLAENAIGPALLIAFGAYLLSRNHLHTPSRRASG